MDRAAALRAIQEGEEGITEEIRELQSLPALTGEEVQAGGKTRRVALYFFEVGHNEAGAEIATFTPVNAGDIALVSEEQAKRLDAIGFTCTEADYKKTAARKA